MILDIARNYEQMWPQLQWLKNFDVAAKIPDTDSSLKPSSESEYNTRKTKNVNLHFTYLPQVAQNESPKISLIPLQSNNYS